MIQDDKLPLKIKFLKYFKDLPVQNLAAGYIGRSDDTITRWKNEDAGFAGEIEKLKAQWAMKRAKKVKSNEWLLERVIRGHFTPTQNLNLNNLKQTLDKLEDDQYAEVGSKANEQVVADKPPLQDQN
jgi:hypothetical protein